MPGTADGRWQPCWLNMGSVDRMRWSRRNALQRRAAEDLISTYVMKAEGSARSSSNPPVAAYRLKQIECAVHIATDKCSRPGDRRSTALAAKCSTRSGFACRIASAVPTASASLLAAVGDVLRPPALLCSRGYWHNHTYLG